MTNTELLPKEKQTKAFWFDKEIINAADALERLDGDEALLNDILWEFVKILPHRIKKLKNALESKDAELTEQVAYSIRGAAWIVGANSMVDQAFLVELAARSRNLSKAGLMYKNLSSNFARVRVALSDRIEPGFAPIHK